jgi:AmiR/NasT family two-component response regulator
MLESAGLEVCAEARDGRAGRLGGAGSRRWRSDQVDSLAEAFAASKAIERAKGLLMENQGLTEQDAFAQLRRASQTSGRPMRVIAEAIIQTLGA